MSAYSDRCEREDEEDRLRPWLAQIRSLNAELAATQERAQRLIDGEIAADKAASPFFSASTYREDYRYS